MVPPPSGPRLSAPAAGLTVSVWAEMQLLVRSAVSAPAAGLSVSVWAEMQLLVRSLFGRVRKCKFSTRPTHEMLSGRQLAFTQRHSGYNVNTHKTDGVNKVISRLNIFKFNYKSRNFSSCLINGSQ